MTKGKCAIDRICMGGQGPALIYGGRKVKKKA